MKKYTSGNTTGSVPSSCILSSHIACGCHNKMQPTWSVRPFSEAFRTVLVWACLGFLNISQT